MARVHRQLKRVFTNHSSGSAGACGRGTQAISWICTSPVTWASRGRKQASWLPAGSRLRATAGRLWYSQTSRAVPTASRSPATASPIGRGKARKWVLSVPSSFCRSTASLPAW
jgi:hypothetical protein